MPTLASVRVDATKNFVNDAFEWSGGVDCASPSNAFLRLVQAHDDFSFRLPSAPVAGVNEYALVNPPHHRVKVVDFEDENAVEKLDEFRSRSHRSSLSPSMA